MSARLLVIEDNPTNMDLMCYLLRAFGHTVLTASDGEEGLEVARRNRPDLVICDIQLPQMDGFEFIHCCRVDPILRKTLIVAVTALAMVGDRDKVLAFGFDGYLTKPITPDTFVGQIEAFLDIKHSSHLPRNELSPVISITHPLTKTERGLESR